MSEPRETPTDEESTDRTYCSCGEPILGLTVLGPSTAYASPCGCRVWPTVLESNDE